MSIQLKSKKIKKAVVKAVLSSLLESMSYDDETKLYGLNEGAMLTMDKQFMKVCKEFITN
jgi:hypothetical protein